MAKYEPGEFIAGPIVKLAENIKMALEPAEDEKDGFQWSSITTEYGAFYVSKIELTFTDGYTQEIAGYLIPNDADGKTFDLFTAKLVEEEDPDGV